MMAFSCTVRGWSWVGKKWVALLSLMKSWGARYHIVVPADRELPTPATCAVILLVAVGQSRGAKIRALDALYKHGKNMFAVRLQRGLRKSFQIVECDM